MPVELVLAIEEQSARLGMSVNHYILIVLKKATDSTCFALIAKTVEWP